MDYKLDFFLQSVLYRSIDPHTAYCIERLHAVLPRKFMWVPLAGDALVARARSIAASLFLKSEIAPYMIFIDGDIVFEPEDIEKLYQDLCDGYDLVGGFYVVRDGSQSAHFGWDANLPVNGKVNEVEYLSTGFTGISLKMLKQMREELKLPLLNEGEHSECWPFFESGAYVEREEHKGKTIFSRKKIYISEDWDFCEKARKIGVKSYCDTSILLGHIGTKKWTIDDLRTHMMEKEREQLIKEPELSRDYVLESTSA